MPINHDITYAKWDPSGNTTLFLLEKPASDELRVKLAQAALNRPDLAAEQAGFIWATTLQMAGNEFCLNATSALAAHLYTTTSKNLEPKSFSLQVSGWPSPILAMAQANRTNAIDVTLTLELPKFSLEILPNKMSEQIFLVQFEGISHFLIPKKCSHETAPMTLKELIKCAHLESEPCVGCIWWEELGPNQFQITPLVFVKDVGSCVFEQACGSGSLALALYLAQKKQTLGCPITIYQPSHAQLSCQVDQKTAQVKSQVNFLAQGKTSLHI